MNRVDALNTMQETSALCKVLFLTNFEITMKKDFFDNIAVLDFFS